LVRPARGFSPGIHRCQDHRDAQALSPHHGKGPTTFELFSINPRDDGMLEDPGEDGKINNTLRFKGIDLKT
jgi:hypothetical protein